MKHQSGRQNSSRPTSGQDGLIRQREKNLGDLFGVEPGLLLKIPADLTTLSIIVGKHLALGGKIRRNGEIEPQRNEELRNECLKLMGATLRAYPRFPVPYGQEKAIGPQRAL